MHWLLPLTLTAAFFQMDAEQTDQRSTGDGELLGHRAPAYAWEFNTASETEGWSGFYVDGTNPSTNPYAHLLQNNLVTPSGISGAQGSGQLIGIDSADIGEFIRDLFDAGAQPGEYAFFTLAHDDTLSGSAYYAFTAADAPSGPKARLEVTTAPAIPNAVHVDLNAAPGGDGSQASPFQTLQDAMDSCVGGETILLAAGDYGGVFYQRKAGQDLYTDTVVVRPHPSVSDPVNHVSIENFIIRDGWPLGAFDLNVRLENLRVRDGIINERGVHFEVNGCKLEKVGPWNGSGENIGKRAVDLFNVNHNTIRNCEVTNTAYGFTIKGSNITIANNHIHHIAHDGIFATALRDCLIEGNRIHNLDDGVDDGDPAGQGWNKHCDGIHLYTSGSGGGTWNERVTIRANAIYDCESQGLIINNTGYNYAHQDIVIENNVFGPTRALPINITLAEGLIFRNNAIIPVEGGRVFTSIYNRDITCNNIGFRIPDNPTGAQIYNNFFPRTFGKKAEAWIDYNAYGEKQQPDEAIARFEQVVGDAKFVNPEDFDGALQSDSPLINQATRAFAPTPIYPDGFAGTIRDNRPDVGPWEYPGLTPPVEQPAPTFVGPATLYVDDFADANFFRDPWLNGQNQQGIEWVTPDGMPQWTMKARAGSNSATLFATGDPKFLVTSEGDGWTDYTARADAMPLGGPENYGFLVRGNLATEGYLVDCKNGAIVIREDTGGGITGTTLGTPVGSIFAGNGQKRHYEVTVEDVADGVQITVRDKVGNVLIQETDPASTFTSGRFALMAQNGNASHMRAMFFDVAVDTGI